MPAATVAAVLTTAVLGLAGTAHADAGPSAGAPAARPAAAPAVRPAGPAVATSAADPAGETARAAAGSPAALQLLARFFAAQGDEQARSRAQAQGREQAQAQSASQAQAENRARARQLPAAGPAAGHSVGPGVGPGPVVAPVTAADAAHLSGPTVTVNTLNPAFVAGQRSAAVAVPTFQATEAVSADGRTASVWSVRRGTGWAVVNIATGGDETRYVAEGAAGGGTVFREPQIGAWYVERAGRVLPLDGDAVTSVGAAGTTLAAYRRLVHDRYGDKLPGSAYAGLGAGGGYDPTATARIRGAARTGVAGRTPAIAAGGGALLLAAAGAWTARRRRGSATRPRRPSRPARIPRRGAAARG